MKKQSKRHTELFIRLLTVQIYEVFMIIYYDYTVIFLYIYNNIYIFSNLWIKDN